MARRRKGFAAKTSKSSTSSTSSDFGTRRGGGHVSPVRSISPARTHPSFTRSTTVTTSLAFQPSTASDSNAVSTVDTTTEVTSRAIKPADEADRNRNMKESDTSAPASHDNAEENCTEQVQDEAKTQSKSTETAEAEKPSMPASPYKRVVCTWKGKPEPAMDGVMESDADSDIDIEMSDTGKPKKKAKKSSKTKTKSSDKKTKKTKAKKSTTKTKTKKKSAATKTKKKTKRDKMEKDDSDEESDESVKPAEQEEKSELSKQGTETEYFRYGDVYAAKPTYARGGIKSDVSPKKQLTKAKPVHENLRRSARLKKKPKVSFAIPQKSEEQLTTRAADKIVPDASGGRRRSKSDINARREIRKYQNSTELLLKRSVFQRLVRELAAEYKTELRFQQEAFELLQEATEAYIVNFLQETQMCAAHAKSSKIRPHDMQLVKAIHRNLKLPAYVSGDPMKFK